jgi:hypothetical protein
MTRKLLTRLISNLLIEKFDIIELKAIQSLLNQGVLMNTFEHAVDKAVETKLAENFQQETLNDTASNV